jgi:hypothetical protein
MEISSVTSGKLNFTLLGLNHLKKGISLEGLK